MKCFRIGGLATLAVLGTTCLASAGGLPATDMDPGDGLSGLDNGGVFPFISRAGGTDGQIPSATIADQDAGLGHGRTVWTFCIELGETLGDPLGRASVLRGGAIPGATSEVGGGGGASFLTGDDTRVLGYVLGLVAGDDRVLDGGDIDGEADAMSQLPIWELVHVEGTSGYRLQHADGTRYAETGSGNHIDVADEWLDLVNAAVAAGSLGGINDSLMAFSPDGFGEQIMLIPLPAPAIMGLVGLGLASIARRRLRRG